MSPPLVKGGQGRSDESVEESAVICAACLILGVVLVIFCAVKALI